MEKIKIECMSHKKAVIVSQKTMYVSVSVCVCVCVCVSSSFMSE